MRQIAWPPCRRKVCACQSSRQRSIIRYPDEARFFLLKIARNTCYRNAVASSWKNCTFLAGSFVLAQACTHRTTEPNLQTSAVPAPNASATTPPEPSSSAIVEANPTAPATSTPSPPPAPPSLEERLDKRAVTDEHYARRELYSWTTADQVAQLRQTKTLLVATGKTHGAPSPYSRLLGRLANGTSSGRDVAKLLSDHPGLTKRRYAWPSPFATAVPLGERSYGHALVHIVLKDGSVLAKLDPLEKEPFTFVDLDNKFVSVTDVVQHPERIAAVFHVRRKPDGGPRFREYIVCNEAMIARWSVGTPHERTIVDEESALITELLQTSLLTSLGKNDALDANFAWSRSLDKPTLLDRWRAALAFDSPKYKPSTTTLGAISTSLAAYEAAGDPLDHVPVVDFPDKP